MSYEFYKILHVFAALLLFTSLGVLSASARAEGNRLRRLAGVAHGAPCAECPAGSGESWDPAGHLPSGTEMPPVHLDCACTIAPSR